MSSVIKTMRLTNYIVYEVLNIAMHENIRLKWWKLAMAKFIRVTNIAQGIDMDTILNVDDIGHISIGPNIIFVKTPFADGTNRIYVRTETIEQLEKILLEGENNG